MAEKYLCCGKNWFEPMKWLDHVEVLHHFTEVLSCPYCANGVEVRNIRSHITDDHLIRCDFHGCLFISESFDIVQRHFSEVHQHSSTSQTPQEASVPVSENIASLLLSLPDVKSVRLAKHLVLHKICSGDRGYGCGYRNAQNIVSSLLFETEYRNALGFNATPSIKEIQTDIEKAWAHGFDPVGAAHFKGRLLGSKQWIGATEIAYHHVRIQLVDITLRDKNEGQKLMVDWIKRYFNSMDPAFPLYLQRKGHSITVIGVEEVIGDSNLLVYDPLVDPSKIRSALNNASAKQLSLILRLPQLSLNYKEYQIVAVRGTLSEVHYEKVKAFTGFNHVVL
uniref:Zinc finger with UFM1-specific peptidase domain protein n=1 Tax=Syphacia muris TaxID=451379 RepID=A0A0N5AMD1_9BILA